MTTNTSLIPSLKGYFDQTTQFIYRHKNTLLKGAVVLGGALLAANCLKEAPPLEDKFSEKLPVTSIFQNTAANSKNFTKISSAFSLGTNSTYSIYKNANFTDETGGQRWSVFSIEEPNPFTKLPQPLSGKALEASSARALFKEHNKEAEVAFVFKPMASDAEINKMRHSKINSFDYDIPSLKDRFLNAGATSFYSKRRWKTYLEGQFSFSLNRDAGERAQDIHNDARGNSGSCNSDDYKNPENSPFVCPKRHGGYIFIMAVSDNYKPTELFSFDRFMGNTIESQNCRADYCPEGRVKLINSSVTAGRAAEKWMLPWPTSRQTPGQAIIFDDHIYHRAPEETKDRINLSARFRLKNGGQEELNQFLRKFFDQKA